MGATTLTVLRKDNIRFYDGGGKRTCLQAEMVISF